MKVAVIGGGITGLCIALESANRGANVTVLERDKIMEKTSRSSTKLLHGGLRYLETFQIRLVREALKERSWWLNNVPDLTSSLEIHMPFYENSSRSWIKYKLGLWIYEKLSGKYNIKNHKWINKPLFSKKNKGLYKENLKGGFIFYDGQMLDYELGCWVAKKARKRGVEIIENCEVKKISTNGELTVVKTNFSSVKKNKTEKIANYDFIINASGSYTEQLLLNNKIKAVYHISHIRGSHIIIDRFIPKGYLFEYPNEERIFFVLPYKNQTLIGTTEVEQDLFHEIKCTLKEKDYLIYGYNQFFSNSISRDDIIDSFTGLRALVKKGDNFSKSSREYAIQIDDKLISVYGGKWTTSRALARNVCKKMKL